MERKVVRLSKDYPFMGANRLKHQHNLPCSYEAIRRILNEHRINEDEFYDLEKFENIRDFHQRVTITLPST
jgi:hypothetical protein